MILYPRVGMSVGSSVKVEAKGGEMLPTVVAMVSDSQSHDDKRFSL